MRPMFRMKLLLYLAPFGVLYLLWTGLLLYTGESLPLAWVVALQSGDQPVLYRPQFGNRDASFKALAVNTRRPQIVATGSSRVLQMRAGLFTEQPDAFYNAGAPAWTLTQVRQMLAMLNPDALPEVLIIGIDAPWFNDDYVPDEFPAPLDDLTAITSQNRAVLQATLDGRPLNTGTWLARRDPGTGNLALGIKAIENGHGFRNDGSEQYGDFLIARFLDPATERDRHQAWMRDGEMMYVYGERVSREALREFELLLAWGAEHDITIIGFMPPYAPRLYEAMTRRGRHPYVAELVTRLADLAAGSDGDFHFFDFSDGAQFGTDADFFDGWHGSERIYLRLMQSMATALPVVFDPYTAADTLRTLDAQAVDTWHIFGD